LKQRTPIEIMYAILGAAVTPQHKTRLVYDARLYSRQVIPYLTVLLKAGLLERSGERTYQTTRKGRDFMQSFERLEMMARIPTYPSIW
jgi:predicted transcriptional regulator